jgi:prefoldin subunit 5
MGDVTLESLKKEKDALISAIESESADIQKLEKYLKDLTFQNMKDNPEKKWTTESFLQENSK